MTERTVDFEAQMLEQAERQTNALENLNRNFTRFPILLALLFVLALLVIRLS